LSGCLVLLALTAALTACSGGSANEKVPGASAKRAVPVVIAPVEQKSVPVQLTAIGTVEAH
jgi:multidrug efflux system membrane fusion protein